MAWGLFLLSFGVRKPIGREVAAGGARRGSRRTPGVRSFNTTFCVFTSCETATDPLGNSVSMIYDANGNLVSFTDPRGGITAFGYDARNRLTSRTDALLKTETLVPDGNDNITSRTDRKAQVTTTTYVR